MDALTLPTSSSTANSLRQPLLHPPRHLLFSPQSLSTNRRGALVITLAKKRKRKPDSHSFAPKPDEATGPFPEAILLKEKTVREDGRSLPEFADAEEEELYEFLSLQLESDLNVERVRHYEVVYLIHEDHVDEVESVIDKVQGWRHANTQLETNSPKGTTENNTISLQFFQSINQTPCYKLQAFIRERKGRIWRLNNWGLRRLAYKIRKAKNANYILMNFELEAKCIDEFKTMLDKDERVIRHLVIKRDEAITDDCPPPPEFHTLRPEGIDDEYDDDDAEDVLDDIEDGENIIIVDEDEDEDESPNRRGRRLVVDKISG